ncbi:protein tramtrack, beta isoform-like isoform X1 [Macrobrachium rosenbergii]|uniref:protein tramtrack, beta isoform-like isoform X1 n=1 Tax=Macrobrachium rosenbergii TaxID=79674 RepID=UPI0034D65EBF
MGEDFLSLKWNNHKPAFFHLLKILREKGCYSDVTLACGSKFFAVHRLVLMACSDFFIEVFDHTHCQKPVIVLKDIKGQELEALLDYMYLGEVEVQQTDLPGLIKAAECLKIKGLAVPDEDPTQPAKGDSQKAGERPAKRRRQEREVRESDRGSVTSHSTERLELRGSHATQTSAVPQYAHHRTDIEIIQGSDQDINPSTITVSHTGGETHLISHDTSIVQRTDVLQVHPEQTSSPNRIQTHETHLEQESHMHHDTTQGQHSESKELESFTHSAPEIKVEHCELEEEIENGTLKSEVTEIHTDPMGETAAGVGEFSHFMTAEENLAHHMFQQAQQAGPSGLHRPAGREGSTETGGEDVNINRGGVVGGGMYPSHLLAEAAPESTSTTVTNQSGSNGGPGGFFQREIIAQHHCPYCPQSFMFQSILKRHLRTHTGEKPYECPNCDYRSAYKYHVARHMKLHNVGGGPPRSEAVTATSSGHSNASQSLYSQSLNMVQINLFSPEEAALDTQSLPQSE